MWCDLANGPVSAGDVRSDEDSQETRTTTDVTCPFCAEPLVRFGGYRERVVIRALVGAPVAGRQLVDIEDIPAHLDLLSCPSCRRNFTGPSVGSTAWCHAPKPLLGALTSE